MKTGLKLKLLLVGDVMPGRLVNDAPRERSAKSPWGNTLPFFQGADWRACILECEAQIVVAKMIELCAAVVNSCMWHPRDNCLQFDTVLDRVQPLAAIARHDAG